uniref:Snake toxin/toxin-like domain-containing protein n=1 Tax=Mustela putorius furo TaxID=9669 RepID=M3XSN1_MUSPF
MRGPRLALLMLGLVTCGHELAEALRCYTCHEPTGVSSCVTVVTCNANETMCKTTLYSLEIGEAFKCFTCEQPTTISLCKNVTRCKPEATACQTVLVQVESGESGPQWSPSPNGPQGWGTAVEVPQIGSGVHKGCISLGAPGPPKAARHAPTDAWREQHGPAWGGGVTGCPWQS